MKTFALFAIAWFSLREKIGYKQSNELLLVDKGNFLIKFKVMSKKSVIVTSKRSFESEAAKLLRAIEIAIESYSLYPPNNLSQEQLNALISGYLLPKSMIVNSPKVFQNLKSLKYLEEAVIGPFNESQGKHVEFFWNRVDEEELGFLRENKLAKIILKGKIKDFIEYDLVIDSMVIAQQEGIINADEIQKLNTMIVEFEKRSLKKSNKK